MRTVRLFLVLGTLPLVVGCEGTGMVLGDFAAAMTGQPLPSQQEPETTADAAPNGFDPNGAATGYPTLNSADRAMAESWSADFPLQPTDDPSQCSSDDSDFTRWINSVTAASSSGDVCVAAKGAYVINTAGAAKARYCAQFYSGEQNAQALQQADAYDGTAAEAVATARQSCGG